MTHPVTYNRPGAPANPPQHLFDEGTGIAEGEPEAHPDAVPQQPGPDHPLKTDIGPNPAVHTGNPPQHPDNAGSRPRSGDFS